MRAPFDTLLLTLLAVAALTDCKGDEEDPCGEPIFGGDATDEAWRTMVDASGPTAAAIPESAQVGSSSPTTWTTR